MSFLMGILKEVPMSNIKFVKALKEQVPNDAKQVDIYLKDNVLYFVNKDEKSMEDIIYQKNQMEINEYLMERFKTPMEDKSWLI